VAYVRSQRQCCGLSEDRHRLVLHSSGLMTKMQEYMQKVQIFAEAFIISATFGWDNGFVAVCLLARTITQNVMGAFWRNLGILIIKYSVHLYRIHKV